MGELHGDERWMRNSVTMAPRGWKRFAWFGPGFIWMVSSVGSGSVLFTPRVGARYGFSLLWIALLGAFLTWVIIREIGRFTVVSGKTLLDGYRELPGPKNWAVWLIFIPGIASGVIVVAGISGLVGSALMIALPGTHVLYALGIMFGSSLLVVTGRYEKLEKVATIMAGVLVFSVLITAILVFPEPRRLVSGLVPSIPEDFDPFFVLPWIGFLLAGAAGVMWFSYWVAARGFGGTVMEEHESPEENSSKQKDSGRNTGIEVTVEQDRRNLLHSWLWTMGITAGIGIVGGTVINISFLTLGAQLLMPQGIIPEGVRVAEDLTQLLTEVWGRVGFWTLIIGIVIALWGSILANQDGWGRMFTDATHMLIGKRIGRGIVKKILQNRLWLRNIYVVIVLTVFPAILFLLLRDPVLILSAGGIISAVHMPFVVFITLYLNRRRLSKEHRPNLFWSIVMVFVGLYYSFFAGFYFYDLFTDGG